MDAREILTEARSILLVDWPHPGVPRSLIEAGLVVFGFSPGRYSLAELVPEPPEDVAPGRVFPSASESDTGFLVFRELAAPPARVDAVAVYRPAEEIAGIIATHVIPLDARILWLQPPVSSAEARLAAADRGLHFIEGVDLAITARAMIGR